MKLPSRKQRIWMIFFFLIVPVQAYTLSWMFGYEPRTITGVNIELAIYTAAIIAVVILVVELALEIWKQVES